MPRPHDADDAEEPQAGDTPSSEPAPDLDDEVVAERWAGIVSELSAADPRSWSPDPAVEEAEDHFVPPDPGPVLGGDPLVTMAWIAVVGVPVLLIVAVVFWRDVPAVVLRGAGLLFVAGVALLLWRMPRDRSDDAGPGAVV